MPSGLPVPEAGRDPRLLARDDSWHGVKAVVAGFGVTGFAVADTLTHLGADVTALGDRETPTMTEQADLLGILGAEVRLGPGMTAGLPDDLTDADLLVTSPGFPPHAPLLVQARERGIPIWGEVELAWRLRDRERPAPWLAVTGTNGKTTTVQMLDSILRTAGLRSAAVGNVGRPVLEVVMDPTPYDVLALELSSFQLHYVASMRAESAAVLNLAEDHLDWYAGPQPMLEYAADKARIFHDVERACVYNVQDPATEQMVREAEVAEGARAIGFTLGVPSVGMLGLVDDVLVDRAFIEERHNSAAELCTLADLTDQAAGSAAAPPHLVANALAAAGLARAHGVSQQAVRDGLRAFRPDGHRMAAVAMVAGVSYIDDSKATNPHAALASLQGYDPVVWIAGGLAKGAGFDDLVAKVRDRLRGVVLIGRDAPVIAAALTRHAPDVPVLAPALGETGDPMEQAVTAATGLAHIGDTVLLAPGCASMDMFADYGARGDAFAAAVRRRQ